RGTAIIADKVLAIPGLHVGEAEIDPEVAHRRDRAFELDAARTHAPTHIALVATPGVGGGIDVEVRARHDHRVDEVRRAWEEALVAIGAVQALRAAVDILDDEHRAVEGVELEVLEV